MKYLLLALIAFITIISGCGKGIEPEPEEVSEGFGGTVYFIGEWPDSITRTHIVVFKSPLLSEADFNAFNLAYVSTEIPYGTAQFNYSSLDSSLFPINSKISSGTYYYVSVAQQKTVNLTLNRSDWFVAGVYYNQGDTLIPGTLVIPEGGFTGNVNIYSDFNNPPPQPPGGNE